MSTGSRKEASLSSKEQYERFIETARQVGADEEPSAADALMGRLAKMPPDPNKAKRQRRDKSKSKPE